MSVPALKEQIASINGVLSEEQRLICRGRVLKDNELLSSHQVEDGHTVRMIVTSETLSPSSLGLSSQSASSTAPYASQTPTSNIVIETIWVPREGDGVFEEIDRIISFVLASLGFSHTGSSTELNNHGVDLQELGLVITTVQLDLTPVEAMVNAELQLLEPHPVLILLWFRYILNISSQCAFAISAFSFFSFSSSILI